MNKTNDSVTLGGKICSDIQYAHSIYGEDFFSFFMSVKRLSGYEDILPVTAPLRSLPSGAEKGKLIKLKGQLRSYNKLIDGVNRLVLTIFATKIELDIAEDLNEIAFEGYLCKPPIYRVTPFKREICDLLLAVNRAYNKSDYIPCITWGKSAKMCSNLPVGCKLWIVGRIQSREYEKQTLLGLEHRTAYEVSISHIEFITSEPKQNT
ncbi:MAG: single-stranded DNA-binding protein [Christensenellales bacterium]